MTKNERRRIIEEAVRKIDEQVNILHILTGQELSRFVCQCLHEIGHGIQGLAEMAEKEQ